MLGGAAVAAAGAGAGGLDLALQHPKLKTARHEPIWGRPTGSNRVIRGGNWNNNANNCRSANRNSNNPANRKNNLGFLIILAPTQPEPLTALRLTRLPSRPQSVVFRGKEQWTKARCE